MFKLFVLGAVAHAVKQGALAWDQSVALEAHLVSLPSGVLQVDPAGTKFSLAQFAEILISSSDNTAADRLAALVGRQAVETQVRGWSAHSSLDAPFRAPGSCSSSNTLTIPTTPPPSSHSLRNPVAVT